MSMKKNLKLWIAELDTGLAFALANNKERAIKLILQEIGWNEGTEGWIGDELILKKNIKEHELNKEVAKEFWS